MANTVSIKRVFSSENVWPINIRFKRLANQHRSQETLSIGLEIDRTVFEKRLKPVFLVKLIDQLDKY